MCIYRKSEQAFEVIFTICIPSFFTAPQLAPYSVRAFNVRIYTNGRLTVYWGHTPHPELNETIQGFKIHLWLTNNQSVSWLYSVEKRYYFKTTELDINQNYTIVIKAFNESPVMGPASQPVTNHEEIGMFS